MIEIAGIQDEESLAAFGVRAAHKTTKAGVRMLTVEIPPTLVAIPIRLNPYDLKSSAPSRSGS